MLRIECPYCGPRDEQEFSFGGQSHISRPVLGCTDEEWTRYLYFRENPRGLHAERWCHSFGCGQWFNVLRDTVTHVIRSVYRMGDPKPGVDDSERGGLS
jgi:heterotetrameric sarcosine oxidase delta subunit